MPENPEHFYLSVADYKAQTLVPSIVNSMSDDAVGSLLLETMALIDAYIGDGWMPFDDDQEFIFPRCRDEDSDGSPFIPRPVSLATRMTADSLMQKRQKGISPHEVASETNLGHSYTRKESTVESDIGFEDIPPSAIALLEKYKQGGGVFAVSPQC